MLSFKNNSRNGFTLIELLVIIVIMISILILSIVSFNDVITKNKEKAWDKVKNEIEMAAKDYYEINSYKLENLNYSSVYARVSVGTLVNNDFINVVTDPRNNVKIDSCDYVEVTKENDKYQYKYYENKDNGNCDAEEVIILIETGAPSIEVMMSKMPTGNNNYYIEPVDAVAIVDANNNIPIKEVKYKFNDSEFNFLELNVDNKYEVPAKDGKSITITFVASNILDNTAIGTITYKKDTKSPLIKEFKANSVKTDYNSNNISLLWDITDELSGLGVVSTNIKNNNGMNHWDQNGASTWKFNDNRRYFVGADSLDGSIIKPTLTVYDVAGNKTIKTSDDYSIYKECDELKDGEIVKGNFGNCSNTCGTGNKTRKVTTTFKDKYTLKVCDIKTSSESMSCTDKTDCEPFISNVSFRYNETKCPKGHVELKYKDINIDKYIATMTYFHSVQGTTNTAKTIDDADSSEETFCRGYGSRSDNIMNFEVTIVNKLNKNKKAVFKGNCEWSKMYQGGLNNSWHDCTINKR